MLMPKWAKAAATRLSDEELAFSQPAGAISQSERPNTVARPRNLEVGPAVTCEDVSESVAGTVSRKGKFGFTCENCHFVPKKTDKPDWASWNIGCKDVPIMKSIGLHFPKRCRRCKSRMDRWTCAARNYDKLEILRQLEGRKCLRFVTFTREDWNVKIPAGGIDYDPWKVAEPLKKSAVKKFNNWRQRNKYWKTRDAKGQSYYECTMYPVWNGWGFDEVKLHFHIHTVVCSKRLENKDIQINIDTLEPIPLSTTMQRNWGGIVDVRACKTWKHKNGEMKTSKRFVMNYLVDYINKSPHWQSTKFGDWSS